MSFVADNSVVVGWFIQSQLDFYSSELLDRAAKEDVCAPSLILAAAMPSGHTMPHTLNWR